VAAKVRKRIIVVTTCLETEEDDEDIIRKTIEAYRDVEAQVQTGNGRLQSVPASTARGCSYKQENGREADLVKFGERGGFDRPRRLAQPGAAATVVHSIFILMFFIIHASILTRRL